MEIKRGAFSKTLDSFDIQETDKVSLFVYSKKTANLKRLDLAKLSPEKRTEKLKDFAKDNRFVAVVERGDAVFAFTSTKYADQLAGQQDLSIDGKKVSVKKLSETEYERLADVGQEIEKFLEVTPEEELQEQRDEKSEEKLVGAYKQRQYLAKLYDKVKYAAIDIMIMKMANIPERIKLSILTKMNEHIREEKERSKEASRKKDQKQAEIEQRVIYSGILKKQREKKEIETKEINREMK